MPEKSPTPWLPGYREKPGAQTRLFCFPYAGGNAGSFRPWSNLLPNSVQVLAVQPPGRGERLSEPPFKHLPDLIDVLGPTFLPFLDRPFGFFGHSMGALIGFELTRWLRRTKNPLPVHFFVSGRRAPQFNEEELPSHDLPEAEFIERLRELNGTPHEVLDHPELMKLMIPLLRADFSVCETYRHEVEPPLNCPMTVFGGLGDVEVPRERLEPWKEHTTSTFSLHMLPGDHFFIHSAQNEITRVIAQKLTSSN